MSGRVLYRELQILGGPECHLLARFDLDGLSGRRISAHAGCARANLQDAEARNPDPLTFLEMLGDQAHKVAEDRLPRAFRELMILGQPCRQMLERNGASFGSSRWCFRFAWARNRHDGLPSSEARKCAGRKRYDSGLYGELCFRGIPLKVGAVAIARSAGPQGSARPPRHRRDIVESIRERSGVA